ncbi:MAG: histidine--tRNA ligase [Parachlamydiaceae bacterium]
MDITIPPGVFDILPVNQKEPWKSTHLWNYFETLLRDTAHHYGFQEIRTPIFEKTELFNRGVGETSDIVTKEMYTFKDKGDRSLTLRPEGTASVMRAFSENRLQQASPIHKLFYIAPMFRYERAQAGRFRQHHQFGVEVVGVAAPEQDAEVIDLAFSIFKNLKINNLEVSLNSIGDQTSRTAYHKALKEYLQRHLQHLSKESQVRFEKNPLRILDSKDPTDKEIVAKAPIILDFLNQECLDHFETVQRTLKILDIPFKINPLLVRGLDYYSKTVFEVTSENLGSQNSICGGGRYDGLLKSLGGADLPATGFALGMERVLQAALAQHVPFPAPPCTALYFIPLGQEAKELCLKIVHELRQAGIAAQMELTDRKLNKAMNYANQIGAKYVAVVGEQELANKEIELKEMATGSKLKAPLYRLTRIFTVEETSIAFLKLWQEMTQPFEDADEAEFFMKRLSDNIAKTTQANLQLKKALLNIQSLLGGV